MLAVADAVMGPAKVHAGPLYILMTFVVTTLGVEPNVSPAFEAEQRRCAFRNRPRIAGICLRLHALAPQTDAMLQVAHEGESFNE